MIQRKDFKEERDKFDVVCDQVIKEIDTNGSPTPETISDLLSLTDAIDKKIDTLPLSESENVHTVETKWRKESKAFLRELNRTLGNCSKLDSEKLAKCVFKGKTLGDLIDHLDSKGLRFSHPSDQDANLYASIFLAMRYAYQEYDKRPSARENAELRSNTGEQTPPPPPPSAASGPKRKQRQKQAKVSSQPKRLGDAVATPGDKFFVGIWLVGGNEKEFSFTVALSKDFTAIKSNTGGRGKWAYVNGDAEITWRDGWRDILRAEADGVHKYAFAPGVSLQSPPSDTSPAIRQTDDPQGYPALAEYRFFVGTWLVEAKGNDPSYTSLRDDFSAESDTHGQGRWVLANGEARIRWSDGWQDVLRRYAQDVTKRAFAPGVSLGASPTETGTAKKEAR